MTYTNSYQAWGPVPGALRGNGDASQISVPLKGTGGGKGLRSDLLRSRKGRLPQAFWQ